MAVAEVLKVRERQSVRRSDAGCLSVHHEAGNRVVDAPREAHEVHLQLELLAEADGRGRRTKASLLGGDAGDALVAAALTRAEPREGHGRGGQRRGRGGRGGRDPAADVLEGRQLQVGLGRDARSGAVHHHVRRGVEKAAGEADIIQLHGGRTAEAQEVLGGAEASLLAQHIGHALVGAPRAPAQLREDAAGGRGRPGRGRGRHRCGCRGDALADELQRRQRGVVGGRGAWRHAVYQGVGHGVERATIEAHPVNLQLQGGADAEGRGCSVEALVL
mmetsp:Transcript_17727/g.40048  ORF Transcript_17727/g.40048 Transcript_17727/m.40048 type:complete len:275 (-) Transcript_17727:216-1040(-)